MTEHPRPTVADMVDGCVRCMATATVPIAQGGRLGLCDRCRHVERLAEGALGGCRHSAHELVVRLVAAEDEVHALARRVRQEQEVGR